MDCVVITTDRIDIVELTNKVRMSQYGAISMFLGMTRDTFDGKKVLRLEYEAHPTMARKEMLNICSQIRQKWTVGHVAIIHRIGIVPVEEDSVAIAVSSVHRKESLEAVQFAIDTLKQSVPIWKKEVYDDGESEWKANAK